MNKIIAVTSLTKKDITLEFSRGAEFEDKYNLLKGARKVSKNLKLKHITDINQDVICYYINQALELDTK